MLGTPNGFTMLSNCAAHDTLIGFDFGIKSIGVAIGQTLTRTANPLTSLTAKDGTPQWAQIDKLLTTWQPTGLVVGIPYGENMERVAKAAAQFAHVLAQRYTLPVYTVDERLSSKAARAKLQAEGGYKALNKPAVDAMAAKLILEQWLKEPQQGRLIT